MKIIVTKLKGVDGQAGDAQVLLLNRSGEIIHVEQFSGRLNSGEGYIRDIPVSFAEFYNSKAISSGDFEYVVVV